MGNLEPVRDESGLEWSGRASWRRGHLRVVLKMERFSPEQSRKEGEERHFWETERCDQRKRGIHIRGLGELSQSPVSSGE